MNKWFYPKNFRALALLLLFIPLQHFAQNSMDDMMSNHDFSIEEVKTFAEEWFKKKGKGEGSGWNSYQRWLNYNEPRFYPDGIRKTFDPNILKNEFEKYKRLNPSLKTSMAGEFWKELGPDYAQNFLPPGYANGIGRVETVWADPQNGDTLFLGSRSGGFWRSFDGGLTWQGTTQNLPGVGVWDMAVRPDRHSDVFILTQHGTGYSLGILKSTDFGATWNSTGLSRAYTANEALKKILIPITAPDSIYVSSDKGFYRSGNGGATWTTLSTSNVRDFEIKPGTSNQLSIIFTSNNSEIKFSTDGGTTWPTTTTISGNGTASSRLRTCRSFPNQLFFQSTNGVWTSTNSGSTFTNVGTCPENMAFGVSDTDPNIMVLGGLDQYLSTDGGVSFNLVCPWANPAAQNYVHADGRAVRAWNGVLYLCTDGYLAKSTDDGTNWSILNVRGTPLREFYRIGLTPINGNMLIGGSQDNGTSIRIDTTWYEWYGADGMDCFLDRNNSKTWYGTVQNGGLLRTFKSGQTANGIRPESNSGSWITPHIADPNNEKTIFCAYDTVYKSINSGNDWIMLGDFSAEGNMNEMAISPVDSNILYISKGRKIWTSSDNGVSWTEVTGSLPNHTINRIACHPNLASGVTISMSGFTNGEKIYHSTNGGTNWTNFSYNLPNLPANCLAWEAGVSPRLYVGLDAGVYYLNNASTSYTAYNDSLPLVEVTDLQIHQETNFLFAGTWGRGAWKIPLVGRENAPRITEIMLNPESDLSKPTDRDSVRINAKVWDDILVSSVQLKWGFDGVNYPNTISMSLSNADTFVTQSPIPPQSLGTKVFFKITAIDNQGNSTESEKLVYRIKEAILCAAIGSTGTGSDYINQATLLPAGFTNISSQEGYGDFRTFFYPVIQPATVYTLSMALNYAFPLDTAFAWIDWDNNLSFEPNEQITMSSFSTGNISTGTFTLPAVTAHDTLILRIRNVYGTFPISPDPCGDYFGEVEDYSVIVETPVVNRIDEKPFTISAFPVPAKNELTIVMNRDSDGMAITDLMGKEITLPEISHSKGVIVYDVSHLPAGMYLFNARSLGKIISIRFSVLR